MLVYDIAITEPTLLEKLDFDDQISSFYTFMFEAIVQVGHNHQYLPIAWFEQYIHDQAYLLVTNL